MMVRKDGDHCCGFGIFRKISDNGREVDCCFNDGGDDGSGDGDGNGNENL